MFAFLIEPNEEATISYWNKTWLDYTGQTHEEASGRAWDGIIHPDDVPGVLEIYLAAFEKREPYHLPNIRVRRHDGIYRWHLFKSNPRYLSNGTFVGYIGVGFDVHVSKLAMDSLQESEERFRNLVEHAPSPICILKGENMVLEVANEPVYKIWNVGKEVLGKPFLEIIPEMKDQPFMDWLLDVYHNGVTHYGKDEPAYFSREDGVLETFYFDYFYQPYHKNDGTISGVMVVATDVTEQVLLRKKTEETNQRYHNMLMQSPFGFSIMKGEDMTVVMANEIIKKFWGKGNDVEGKTLLELLPELADQSFPGILENVYNTGTPYFGYGKLARLVRTSRMEDRYFNVVYQPHYEADDTISGVITMVYDVTEMVQARKNAEENEYRYRMLIEESMVATSLFHGKEHTLAYANDLILKTWGKDRTALGKPIREVLPDLLNQPFYGYLDEVYRSGNTHSGIEEKAVFTVLGVPQTFYFDYTLKALRDYDGKIYGIHNTAFDVTSQVLAKKELQKSESHFRLMADLMPGKVSNADPAGAVTYFNKCWLDFTGLSLDELEQFGYHQIMHEDELPEFQKTFHESCR